MVRRGQSRTITAISSAALVAAGALAVGAQETPEPDFRFTVDVGAGLSVDDNEELDDPSQGTTTRADVGATFGLVNETEVSRLAASVLTEIRYSTQPGPDDGLEFWIPLGTIEYAREGKDSALNLSGRYFYDRVDDDVLIFLDEDLNPVDLIVDGGDLRRWTIDGGLGIGLESPIGVALEGFYDNRDYIDTTDPDLYDRTNWGVSGALSFGLTDTLRARLTASYERLDEDDFAQTLTETTDLGFGATYDIDEITVFSGDVSYSNIEETFFDTFSTTTEGWIFDFFLQRELGTGTISAGLERTLSQATQRTQLTFGRATELPAGDLDYTLGVSFADDGGETRFVGGVNYNQELPTGSFTVSADQSTTTSDDEEDTLVTRIALGYNHDINSVSSVGVSFGLGRSEDIGGGGEDPTTRANLGVTYRHALTREWDWLLGYEARYQIEEAAMPRPATGYSPGSTAASRSVPERGARSGAGPSGGA